MPDQETALIVGSGRGLSASLARLFAAEGMRVALAARNVEKLAPLVAEIGGTAHACDASDPAAVKALFAAVTAEAGAPDVVVYNASNRGGRGPVEDLDPEAVRQAILVTCYGGFLVGQAAARAMVTQGKGAIVNMSSANAVVAIPNQVPYVTSKGAVNQLTKVMALALADKGVRVNAIGPGSIMTELLKVVMHDDAARQRILSRTPMGRCGEPAEIAKVALFLASDDASYITGQCIYPDGGRLALNYTVPVAAG